MVIVDDLHQVAPLFGGEFDHGPIVENQELDYSRVSFIDIWYKGRLLITQQRVPLGIETRAHWR